MVDSRAFAHTRNPTILICPSSQIITQSIPLNCRQVQKYPFLWQLPIDSVSISGL